MAKELDGAALAALLERANETGFEGEATDEAKAAAVQFCTEVQRRLPTPLARLLDKEEDDRDRLSLIALMKEHDLKMVVLSEEEAAATSDPCAWCHGPAQRYETIMRCRQPNREGYHRYDGWTHITVECRAFWDIWKENAQSAVMTPAGATPNRRRVLTTWLRPRAGSRLAPV